MTKNLKNLLIENRLIKNKVVVPDEFEFEEGNKYYIGCKDGEFVTTVYYSTTDKWIN